MKGILVVICFLVFVTLSGCTAKGAYTGDHYVQLKTKELELQIQLEQERDRRSRERRNTDHCNGDPACVMVTNISANTVEIVEAMAVTNARANSGVAAPQLQQTPLQQISGFVQSVTPLTLGVTQSYFGFRSQQSSNEMVQNLVGSVAGVSGGNITVGGNLGDTSSVVSSNTTTSNTTTSTTSGDTVSVGGNYGDTTNTTTTSTVNNTDNSDNSTSVADSFNDFSDNSDNRVITLPPPGVDPGDGGQEPPPPVPPPTDGCPVGPSFGPFPDGCFP